ncbi:GUN4 domain-containing protein [Pannus brasiliensis CCIBt3594]|uniref:GUN4 domain-containing protein n=1 Tax=Pannus brasiliensis CCIBt3594 TaxID=1427578 RepID=A0AAW9R154_9CHRO
MNSHSLETWREKLAYLQQQEAIASNPSTKFELQKQIEECKRKIAELIPKDDNQTEKVGKWVLYLEIGGNGESIDPSKNPAETGQKLYDWLNGREKRLENHPDARILAIDTGEDLARYPWETLHDGRDFLVNRHPPIIPVRWVKGLRKQPVKPPANRPENRPLNVLFMAADPIGIEPKLDFEAEERKILEGTKRYPLHLVVEESGDLEELRCSIEYYPDRFDILHLVGRVIFKDGKVCLLTENELGDPVYSSAEDIARAIDSFPELLIISGKSNYPSLLDSLVRQLLKLGAKTVLAIENDASIDPLSIVYRELAVGRSIYEAIASVYGESCRNERSIFPRMKLYVSDAETVFRSLVTKPGARGRTSIPAVDREKEKWRDPSSRKMRVATRENFVGRRRQLQNCLSALKREPEKVGILVHGMGGWGKSSLVSRLWDRLPEHDKILWSGWKKQDGRVEILNESIFVKELKQKLYSEEFRELDRYLQDTGENFSRNLAHVLEKCIERKEKTILFIFDDFEWNLEPDGGSYRLLSEPARVLQALIDAILTSNTDHKIIITCRYNEFDPDILRFFHIEGLNSLQGADLQKKLNRLENFNREEIPRNLIDLALEIADGNPRLLEDLDEQILSLSPTEAERKLQEYQNNPNAWKERVIWPDLYDRIDEPLAEVLSRCLIYELPVPFSAIKAVCQGQNEQIQRGITLGIIEQSPEPREANRVYRVSRILPRILSRIHLPEEEQEFLTLSRIAAWEVDRLWNDRENEDEEKWREIFRLSFLDTENPRRFREGFSKMLAVQYNQASDSAFEKELRQQANYLSKNHLFDRLKSDLQAKDWRKADQETAWICYQIMIIEEHEDFYGLFRNMSSKDIDIIDNLWSRYSNEKFGCKCQAKIYQNLGGTANFDRQIWRQFGDTVGWRLGGTWLKYENITFDITANVAHLPVLMYYGICEGGGWVYVGKGWERWSLLSRQDLSDCSL